MSGLLDALRGLAAVVLIVFAVRWLTTAKGSDSPKIRDGLRVYAIRWPVRAVAYVAAVLFLVLAFANLRVDFAAGRWPLDVLFALLALGAAWLGTGVVTSDQKGISKRLLWHSSSLTWEEISEVRLRRKDGGAIELRGNGRKLIVDSRFVAAAHLRREIEQRKQLQPVRD